MRKSMKTEEWKNQRLHQFFAKLNGELPQITEDQQVEACCLSQYEQFVAITFSANILLKGVDYANRIYNHIVKVECTRLSKEIVKQPMDPAMKEKMLLNIQKKKRVAHSFSLRHCRRKHCLILPNYWRYEGKICAY